MTNYTIIARCNGMVRYLHSEYYGFCLSVCAGLRTQGWNAEIWNGARLVGSWDDERKLFVTHSDIL
jgi:hypothetical protein